MMCESESYVYYEKVQKDEFGLMGCYRAMFSNRLLYWLDINGKLKCEHNKLQFLRSCQNL